MTVKRKLNSRAGFTMAEMLLAVLIMLLVAVILANGVPVAKNAYEKVVLTANAQSLLSTAIATLRDELGTAWDIDVPETSPQLTEEGKSRYWIEYYSADTGARTRLNVEIESGKSEGEITRQRYYEMSMLNNGANSSDVEAPLISATTSTENLRLTCGGLTYDPSTGIVTVENMKVSKGDTVLASQDVLEIRVFSAPKG